MLIRRLIGLLIGVYLVMAITDGRAAAIDEVAESGSAVVLKYIAVCNSTIKNPIDLSILSSLRVIPHLFANKIWSAERVMGRENGGAVLRLTLLLLRKGKIFAENFALSNRARLPVGIDPHMVSWGLTAIVQFYCDAVQIELNAFDSYVGAQLPNLVVTLHTQDYGGDDRIGGNSQKDKFLYRVPPFFTGICFIIIFFILFCKGFDLHVQRGQLFGAILITIAWIFGFAGGWIIIFGHFPLRTFKNVSTTLEIIDELASNGIHLFKGLL